MEGSIHTKQYEKDGVKKYVTEIRMSQLVMLDSKKDSQTNTETQDTPPITEDVNGDLPF
jgi:single-strand DNA-binding protein